MLQYIYYGPILGIASSILRLPIIKNKLSGSEDSVPVHNQLLDVATAFIPLALAVFFSWFFTIITLPLITKGVVATALLIYSAIDYAYTINGYKDLNQNIKLIPLQIIIFLNSKHIFGIIKQMPKAVFSTSWIKTSISFIQHLLRIAAKAFMLPISAFQGILLPIITPSVVLALVGISIYYPHTSHLLSMFSTAATLLLCYLGYTQFIALGFLLPVLSLSKLLDDYKVMHIRHIQYLTYTLQCALWLIYIAPVLIHTIPASLLITLIYSATILVAFKQQHLRLPLAMLSIIVGILLWPYSAIFKIPFLIIHGIIPATYIYHELIKAHPKAAKQLLIFWIVAQFISFALAPYITTTSFRLLPPIIIFTMGFAIKYKEINIALQGIFLLVINTSILIPTIITSNIAYIASILSYITAVIPYFKWHYHKGAKRSDVEALYLTLGFLGLLLPDVLGIFIVSAYAQLLPLISVVGAVINIIAIYKSDINNTSKRPIKLASFSILLSTLSKGLYAVPALRASALIAAYIGHQVTSISASTISAKRLEFLR